MLVDPLDTSELAVRALYGYTHVLVYSPSCPAPSPPWSATSTTTSSSTSPPG